MRTMHEMKETTNQEIVRQAQFQQFLENSKEQIIQAARTPLFSSTPMLPSSSGMIRTGQNPTSIDYDYPSTPSHMRLLGGHLYLNNPSQRTRQVMEEMRQTRGPLTDDLRRHYVSSKQEKNSTYLPMDLVLDQTPDPWSKGLCKGAPRLSCLPMTVRMTLTCFWFHLRE